MLTTTMARMSTTRLEYQLDCAETHGDLDLAADIRQELEWRAQAEIEEQFAPPS